jgi:hypothetical protein
LSAGAIIARPVEVGEQAHQPDVGGAEQVHDDIGAAIDHHLGLATDADLPQAFGFGRVELDRHREALRLTQPVAAVLDCRQRSRRRLLAGTDAGVVGEFDGRPSGIDSDAQDRMVGQPRALVGVEPEANRRDSVGIVLAEPPPIDRLEFVPGDGGNALVEDADQFRLVLVDRDDLSPVDLGHDARDRQADDGVARAPVFQRVRGDHHVDFPTQEPLGKRRVARERHRFDIRMHRQCAALSQSPLQIAHSLATQSLEIERRPLILQIVGAQVDEVGRIVKGVGEEEVLLPLLEGRGHGQAVDLGHLRLPDHLVPWTRLDPNVGAPLSIDQIKIVDQGPGQSAAGVFVREDAPVVCRAKHHAAGTSGQPSLFRRRQQIGRCIGG